jgi:hypothetical protein
MSNDALDDHISRAGTPPGIVEADAAPADGEVVRRKPGRGMGSAFDLELPSHLEHLAPQTLAVTPDSTARLRTNTLLVTQLGE